MQLLLNELWVLIVVVGSVAVAVAAVDDDDDASTNAFVSYVIEPFEPFHDLQTQGNPLTEISYTKGNQIKCIEYGGVPAFAGRDSLRFALADSGAESENRTLEPYVIQGWAQSGRLWNVGPNHVQGSTSAVKYLKFAYQLKAHMNEWHWRFTLFHAGDCDNFPLECDDKNDIVDVVNDETPFNNTLQAWAYASNSDNNVSPLHANQQGWTEITIPMNVPGAWHPLEADQQAHHNNNASETNSFLDLQRLKSWRLEFWPNIRTNNLEQDTSELPPSSPGYLLLDHLHFTGDGSMFAAPFYHDSFQQALNLQDLEFLRPPGPSLTQATLTHGTLLLNYTVNRFTNFRATLPSRSYFNLSQASALSWNWTVVEPATPSNRIQLQLILQDAGECAQNCVTKNNENYISSHYVLDGNEEQQGQIMVPLNSTLEGAFQLSAWFGKLGNQVLDRSTIKTYVISLLVSRNGPPNTIVKGAVKLENIHAVAPISKRGDGEDEDDQNDQPEFLRTMRGEPGLQFVVDGINEDDNNWITRLPNLLWHEECQQECAKRGEDCLYGMSERQIEGKGPCYLATSVPTNATILQNDGFFERERRMFWKHDAPQVRGDFCRVCHCDIWGHGDEGSIDCRGRNLTVVPQTFSESWRPRLLDLRGNPELTLLLSGALDAIQNDLYSLFLPKDMQFVSHTVLSNLTRLQELKVDNDTMAFSAQEEPDASGVPMQLINLVRDDQQPFSDICCTRGESLQFGSEEWKFCLLEQNRVGSDSIYEDYIMYHRNQKVITELNPRSGFMAEAAQSASKCAEFCKIQPNCRYFTYDNRFSLSEPRCRHYFDQGEREIRDQDFADEEQTQPGIVSGSVPLARNQVDNARVLVTPLTPLSNGRLELSEDNGYSTRYLLSLGALPLRGAVWIVPRVAASTVGSVVAHFSPSRVVLYDDQTTVPVDVTIFNGGNYSAGGSLVIENVVESCDQAFQTSLGYDTFLKMDIVVVSESSEKFFKAMIALAVVIGLFLMTILIYIFDKRQHQLLKLAQAPFLAMDVICAIIIVCTFFVYFDFENWHCRSQSLISQLPISVMAATAVARVWRTYVILRSAMKIGNQKHIAPKAEWLLEFLTLLNNFHKCRQEETSMRFSLRSHVTDMDVARLVLLLSFPQIVVQVIGISLFPNRLSEDTLSNGLVTRVTCDWDVQTWFGVSFNLFLFSLAVFVAHVARDLPNFLNEKDQVFRFGSISIALSLFLIVGRTLMSSPTTNPDLLTLVWLIQGWGTALSVVVISVLPKAIRVYRGEVIVVSALFNNSTESSNALSNQRSGPFSGTATRSRQVRSLNYNDSGESRSGPFEQGTEEYTAPKRIMRVGDAPPRKVELQLLQMKKLVDALCSSTVSGEQVPMSRWRAFQSSVEEMKGRLDLLEFQTEEAVDTKVSASTPDTGKHPATGNFETPSSEEHVFDTDLDDEAKDEIRASQTELEPIKELSKTVKPTEGLACRVQDMIEEEAYQNENKTAISGTNEEPSPPISASGLTIQRMEQDRGTSLPSNTTIVWAPISSSSSVESK